MPSGRRQSLREDGEQQAESWAGPVAPSKSGVKGRLEAASFKTKVEQNKFPDCEGVSGTLFTQ